ncbi:MAG TPA: hypothetical protein VNV66_20120 [Pilimelia sp.]|nr:hypothetical protein [Pilimelia sp.]
MGVHVTEHDRTTQPPTAPPQAETEAYEPPQLWQYGSLRVDTGHGFVGSILDHSLNIS